MARATSGARAVVALAVLALLLSACAAAPAREGDRVLSVLLADDWASAPVVAEVVAEFERSHEGLRVQVQPAPFSQIPDLVRNGGELGDDYDVAQWHAFAAGADGLAQPLDDLWEEAGLTSERYLEGAVQDVTWDDEVRYGVPLDVNAMVLLANGTLLDEAGVSAADLRDAERFVEVARDLRDVEGVDHALTVSASTWAAYGWIRAFGGDVLVRTPDGQVTFTFDDPATIGALEALATLVADGSAPAPFAPDLALDAVQSFSQGSVALHASGSWDLTVTSRSSSAVAAEDLEVLPLPRSGGDGVDAGTVLGGSSLFVPTGSEQRELAFAFMQALTTDEVAGQLALTEGRLPAARAVYDDPGFSQDPRIADFVAQLDDADVMPLIAYPGLDAAFTEALEAVLKGADAGEVMAAVQSRAEGMGQP